MRADLGHMPRPTWDGVLYLLAETLDRVQASVDRYAAGYGVETRNIFDAEITYKVLTHEEVGKAMKLSARIHPKVERQIVKGQNIVRSEPRIEDLPLVFVRFDRKHWGMLDGRHRADKWRHRPGLYGAVVLDV